MKFKILTCLFLLVLMGCATPSNMLKVGKEDVVIDLRKPQQSKESNLWWLVVLNNEDKKPIRCWMVTDDSLTFLQKSTAILFKDPETGERVILFKDYSFTMMRMGDWYHPDFVDKDKDPKML